jgi:hypothetical protein
MYNGSTILPIVPKVIVDKVKLFYIQLSCGEFFFNINLMSTVIFRLLYWLGRSYFVVYVAPTQSLKGKSISLIVVVVWVAAAMLPLYFIIKMPKGNLFASRSISS